MVARTSAPMVYRLPEGEIKVEFDWRTGWLRVWTDDGMLICAPQSDKELHVKVGGE